MQLLHYADARAPDKLPWARTTREHMQRHVTAPLAHVLIPACLPQGKAGAGDPDAEARAAAVRALTAVAAELCPVNGPPRRAAAHTPGLAHQPAEEGAARGRAADAMAPGEARAVAAVAACGGQAGGADGGAAALLLLERVAPALLAAMGDYATDARGDVGSWVRATAPAAASSACLSVCASDTWLVRLMRQLLFISTQA